jgi:hypothetical protein
MSELERQVFVFTGATLESALAMRDFLTSPAARRHKMSMAAPQGRTPGGLG